MSETTKVVTGLVRMSYANVFNPKSMDGQSDPKYSVALLIPKTDTATIKKIEAAIKLAIAQGKEKWGKAFEGKLATPLWDGDEEKPDDEVYANHYYLNAKSTTPPGIIDKNKNEILDSSEFYSGCYGRASVVFFPYNNVNKGVGVGLQNLQKLKEGEPLGGKSDPLDDFGDDFADSFDDDPLM